MKVASLTSNQIKTYRLYVCNDSIMIVALLERV